MFDKELVKGPPGPELGSLLLGLEVSGLVADDAHEVVLACERLVRAAHAVQAEAMVTAAGPEPVVDEESGREPVDADAEWLAVGLGGSRQFQLGRIDTARYLCAWLPRTWEAMRSGEWGVYEAGLMVRAAQSLTRPDLIGRLEERIVPGGTFDLARKLRRAVARIDPAAVERKKQRARAERSLSFFRDRFGEGEAGLSGSAPSPLMALIAAAIDLDARPRQEGDCRTIEMRRFDVLADWARQRLGLPTENSHPSEPTPADAEAARAAAGALLGYAQAAGGTSGASGESAGMAPANGHPDGAVPEADVPTAAVPEASIPEAVGPGAAEPGGGATAALPTIAAPELPAPVQIGSPLLHQAKRCGSCGRAGPPAIPISVTVSLDTLLGLSREPAELTGWGLLDPDTARDLAADGAWRRWLCDPTTGHLLDAGARIYRPSAALARFVRARDRTCRWPNCHQPAIRCDLDHTEAFEDGGPTTCANLCTLCRRHHRLKHESDGSYQQDPDGRTTWTDSHGRVHVRLPECRHTDWTDWHDPPHDAPDAAGAGASSATDGGAGRTHAPTPAVDDCPF